VGEPSRDGDENPERQPHVSLPVVAYANAESRQNGGQLVCEMRVVA
jgi:hypothetical protein